MDPIPTEFLFQCVRLENEIFAVFNICCLPIFRLSSILTEKISFFSAEKRYVYFFQSDLLCK